MRYRVITMNYRDDAGYPTPLIPVREAEDIREVGKLLAKDQRAVTVIYDTEAREPYQIGSVIDQRPYSSGAIDAILRALALRLVKYLLSVNV